MPLRTALLCAGFLVAASAAQADLARVDSQDAFLTHVSGKTLTRPLVELRVTPDGRIEGTGSLWEVTGAWTWQDGYFCRDLFWGGDPLGYNCQEVRVGDGRMRFTSDKGRGESAVFRLK